MITHFDLPAVLEKTGRLFRATLSFHFRQQLLESSLQIPRYRSRIRRGRSCRQK